MFNGNGADNFTPISDPFVDAIKDYIRTHGVAAFLRLVSEIIGTWF